MPDAPSSPEPSTERTTLAALEDLRARLRATRWSDAPADARWSLGTDLNYLRDLVAQRDDGFNWAAQQFPLARLPRFRMPLGHQPIHFVHARATGPARLRCHWLYAAELREFFRPFRVPITS